MNPYNNSLRFHIILNMTFKFGLTLIVHPLLLHLIANGMLHRIIRFFNLLKKRFFHFLKCKEI